jgi:hypothetical protein
MLGERVACKHDLTRRLDCLDRRQSRTRYSRISIRAR